MLALFLWPVTIPDLVVSKITFGIVLFLALKIVLTSKMHKYFSVTPKRVNSIFLEYSVSVVYCKIGCEHDTITENLILHVTCVLLSEL